MADIAINPVSRRVQFTGNTGTGPFAFTFNILADEDITVYKNTTLLTLTTDYTVATNADGTGSVTLVAALVASDVLTIIGGRELERTTDFVTAGDLLAESLNEQLDSLVIMAQQLDEKMTRSFKVNPGDQFTDLEMPLLDDRKGKYLAFNATTGDPEAGPDQTDVVTLSAITSDIATLADIEDGTDATDAIQTVAGISSNVSTVAGISSNVTTVAGISSDVTTVAGISSDVDDLGAVATEIGQIAAYTTEINAIGDDLNSGSYVAGGEYDFGSITDSSVGASGSPDGFIVTVYNNLSDINAVADIDSDVTAVSNISSDVTAVAGDATDIGTVATNIASVNTVATNIADVITVANDLNEAVSEVVTVADDLNEAVSEIDTVATSISNVDAVGTNIANVNTVAGISANVTTVAGISANTTTVAGISADVTTVAGNSANVTTVAGISSDVTTVAGDSADIQALGPISADITTVAGVSANVTTVAGISANTTTVAGISSDVTTVAGISADTTTVAGISSDVTTVAGDSADIQTVATNISSVNDFADKYRIGATDPTTDLDEGDLFYNTTSDTLKVYNGSAWEAGVTAGSGFMPISGGTFTGAVTFASGQTFDGRDVSADGTKLDGIEANADVTDAANVEPLVDAHINVSGATSGQYLGWNGTDYAWSTVDLSTKLDLSGGTMTGAITFAAGQTFDGRDVSADGSKLDGIEAGADVTDAANVEAAGALMDSEISSLSSVKAINQGLSTSSSPTFSTVTAANFNTTSDATLKTNVETLTGSLDAVKALRGVSYDWIDSGNSEVGVIAQEVEAVIPDLVSTNDEGIKSVKYGNIVAVLIEAIKEQQAQIDDLKAKLGG